MNMLALTAGHRGRDVLSSGHGFFRQRPRIAVPVQLQFALIMLAHLLTFSLLGARCSLAIYCERDADHDYRRYTAIDSE